MRRCSRPLAGSELRELWLRGRSGTLTPLACRQPSALVSPLRGQRGRQCLDSAADAAAHSNCVQCTRNLLNGHGIVCPIPGSVFVGVNRACQSWHVTLKRNLGRCTTFCVLFCHGAVTVRCVQGNEQRRVMIEMQGRALASLKAKGITLK